MSNRMIKVIAIICTLVGLTTGALLATLYIGLANDTNKKVTILQSKETKHTIGTKRKAICMESRTIMFINAAAAYSKHDFVWATEDGNICDTCQNTMMYMLLEDPDTISSTK